MNSKADVSSNENEIGVTLCMKHAQHILTMAAR